MITKAQAQVVLEHYSMLGEGPVWDDKLQRICWVDILGKEIHQYSPETKTHHTISVGQMVGAIAVCKNGNFLAALQNGFAFIDRNTDQIRMIANPEEHIPNNRFNDGKCDPAGRFWAGTMSLSETPNHGNLYVLEHLLPPSKKIEGITISNGLAWSLDHKTFYYIDTPTHEVVAYRYDMATGHISDKKTIIAIPKEDGYPDGMTIDSEGMLWIAHWDGWQLTRWNPDTGQKIHHIGLPVARVTSCTFGGKDLTDLYITSAKVGLTDEQLTQQPLAGALFVIPDSGYKGIAAFEFAM